MIQKGSKPSSKKLTHLLLKSIQALTIHAKVTFPEPRLRAELHSTRTPIEGKLHVISKAKDDTGCHHMNVGLCCTETLRPGHGIKALPQCNEQPHRISEWIRGICEPVRSRSTVHS